MTVTPPAPPPPSATPNPSAPAGTGYRYPLLANPTVADRALVFALAQVASPTSWAATAPVEAANPRRGVRIRDLDEPWYRDRFVAATRIG